MKIPITLFPSKSKPQNIQFTTTGILPHTTTTIQSTFINYL